jgi:CheY-like chemotaxis protein
LSSVAIVDDDPILIELFEQLFRDHGWCVMSLRGEEGATEILRRVNPDLIVLDIRMETRHSGWNILETLRADTCLCDTPVILCTAAEDDVRARKEWLQERCMPVLLKPFDIERLYGMVDDLVPLNRQIGSA